MNKKKFRGVMALILCFILCVSAAASDFTIALPGGGRGGENAENPFPDPVYNAIDFGDFVKATKNLLTLYESIDSDEGGKYASARLIVKASQALPDLSGYHAAQILADASYNYLVQFTNPADAEACDAYLNDLSYVIFSEPDREVKLPEPEKGAAGLGSMETGAEYNSWGVAATKAGEYATNLKARGINSEITVAVVDTGVDDSHPFLSGRVISGYDLVDDDATPQDGNGHGTHVSGTVVDCTPGLKINIMPVRVLNNRGSGSDSVVGLGIQYAVDHGANVINMSLGGLGHSEYIDSQIKYAVSKNVTVVVAAGNEGQDTKDYCPAGDTECITVAAVDKSKSKASFSNYGEAVDIAAPGVEIKSSVPGGGYDSWAGTSMATPHVAAAAALLLCENRSQTPAQIEKKLRDAAEDLGNSGWDRYFGAGFLNMASFIQKVPEPEPEPEPVEPEPEPGKPGNPLGNIRDVPEGSYYYDAVVWALKKGITKGTTETTFSPNATCTTKQILTFIWRANGSPQPKAMTVSGDFGKALAWADETGVSDSVGAQTEEACTRAAAMTYMWQDASKPDSGSNPFSDVSNNTFYAQAVCWAVQKGITNGTTATTFSPNNPCTRAQIMTFLYRYYVKAVNS